MKVKCIEGFSVEKCDDDGCTIPNKFYFIKEGQIWNIDEEENNNFIGGEVRLTRDVKRGCAWMEIPKEMFKEYFEYQFTESEKLELLNSIKVVDYSSSQGETEYIVVEDNEVNREKLAILGATKAAFEDMKYGIEDEDILDITTFSFQLANWYSPKNGFSIEEIGL